MMFILLVYVLKYKSVVTIQIFFMWQGLEYIKQVVRGPNPNICEGKSFIER